jgi:protein translocase SecG subunit
MQKKKKNHKRWIDKKTFKDVLLLQLAQKYISRDKFIFSFIHMHSLLIIVLLIAGLAFSWSVLLMNPKWWLGMGIAGFWGSNEYGSKKSVTSVLKNIAVVSGIIFMLVAIYLPYSK